MFLHVIKDTRIACVLRPWYLYDISDAYPKTILNNRSLFNCHLKISCALYYLIVTTKTLFNNTFKHDPVDNLILKGK